jgi:hypothetical protein
MRFAIVAALALLPLSTTGSFGQTPSELVRSLTLEEIKPFVAEAGMQVMLEDRSGMYVSDGEMRPMRVMLAACNPDKTCAYLRIRTRYDIGTSEPARKAAEFYDKTVPIAFVSIVPATNGNGFAVEIGRDVFLAPGRSGANLVSELKFSAAMAGVFLESLAASDPSLAKELGYGDQDN